MLKIIRINQTGLDYAWNEFQKTVDGSGAALLYGKPSDGLFNRDNFNKELARQNWYDPTVEHNSWKTGLKDFQGRVHEVSFEAEHFDIEEHEEYACRGSVSPVVDKLSMEFLGYSMDWRELQFIMKIHSAATEEKFDIDDLSSEDMEIFRKWAAKRYISGLSLNRYTGNYFKRLTIQKPFWDFISQIVWVAYVDFDNQLI